MTAADLMIAVGALVVAGALVVIAGTEWAALWLGGVLMAAGGVRAASEDGDSARRETGHADLALLVAVVLVGLLVLLLVDRL